MIVKEVIAKLQQCDQNLPACDGGSWDVDPTVIESITLENGLYVNEKGSFRRGEHIEIRND